MGEGLSAFINTYFFNIDMSLIRIVKSDPSMLPRTKLTEFRYTCSLELSNFVIACASASMLRIDGSVTFFAGAAIVGK